MFSIPSNRPHQTVGMNSPSPPRPAASYAGRIVAIDVPNRTLLVRLSDEEVLEVNVGYGCRITLNREPVRLRLLSTGDSIEAAINEINGQLVATSIGVQTRDRHSAQRKS